MPGLAPALTGDLGLMVSVVLLTAYTVYENRRGKVAEIQTQTKALSIAVYRLAQEAEDVDEESVREEVLENGDSDPFPSDFDEENMREYPRAGGDD